ncbi:MAG: hypothetical protein NVSMB9_21360 [Isosphaeraceae bacterium]
MNGELVAALEAARVLLSAEPSSEEAARVLEQIQKAKEFARAN